MRPQHLEFLDRGFSEGRYVMAGRRIPPEGGVLIVRGSDPAEARALADADPYVQSGVAEYELIQFAARRTQAGLEGDEGA